jgi:hypothetical protein
MWSLVFAHEFQENPLENQERPEVLRRKQYHEHEERTLSKVFELGGVHMEAGVPGYPNIYIYEGRQATCKFLSRDLVSLAYSP